MLSRTSLSGAIVALLLVVTLPAFSQSPTFQTQTYAAAPSSTFGVQVDLNQDGALDFVIRGSASGSCVTCIILSNGDGSYRPPVAYDAYPAPLATGDLNGDGHADVVFAGGYAYGNGDGTLRPFVAFTDFVGRSMVRAAVADFNGDGRQDIGVMTQESTGGINHLSVYVLINNGNGGFTTSPATGAYATETFYHFPQANLDIDWQPEMLAVGDFDGDGRADLTYTVTAKYTESGPAPDHSKIVALFNNGGGALTATRIVKDADGFLQGVAGDMNQDGKADLVSQALNCNSTSCSTSIDVFYGSAGRTFTERLSPTTGGAYGYPQIADFNGDHRQDVAMVAGLPNDTFGVVVFTQNADGSFAAQAPYALGAYMSCRACGPPTYYLFAGDFNRDRKPDVATVGGDEAVLRLALNTTSAIGFPGCLHPGGRGINVCSPASGATVASPVAFSIGASDFKPLRKVEVWVDGAKQKEAFFSFADYSYFDAALSLANGSHNVTVYAAGFDNLLQKKNFTFAVGSGGGGTCPTPGVPNGVAICSPQNGTTVNSPISISAAGGTAVTFMEVWMDGTKIFQTSGRNVQTSATLGNGIHKMTVYGRNSTGVVGNFSVTFTVGASSTCSAPSSSTGTVICQPAEQQTVTSPVHVEARGGSAVNVMEVWIDGAKREDVTGNVISRDYTVGPAGQHRLVVISRTGATEVSRVARTFWVQ